MKPPPPEAGGDPLAALFHARGVPCTVQRRAVLEELRRREDHPTADQVYEAVAARLPGLSKATVYRALETLVELGLAVRIGHPGSSARYDGKTWRHHHLICDRCGAVQDLEDPALDKLPIPEPVHSSGFQVRDFSVQISGLCPVCAAQGASP